VFASGLLLNLTGCALYLASGKYLGAFLSLGCASSIAVAWAEPLRLRRRTSQRQAN
jgi:hypothetical protein